MGAPEMVLVRLRYYYSGIWKGRGCSSEILNFTPKRDQSRCGRSLCRPLKEAGLEYRQIIKDLFEIRLFCMEYALGKC